MEHLHVGARRARPGSPRRVDALLARLRRRVAMLSTEVAAQRREREAVRAAAAAVSQTLDPERVVNEAFSRMLSVAGLDAGMISLVDAHTGETRVIAWRGIPEAMIEELHVRKPGEGLAGQVVATGQPVV